MKKIHIELEQGQNIWFTSDLHLGHRNVIRFCQRPFVDEKEMGPKLIDNWNSVVGDNDIVFVLGDTFWFNDSHNIKRVLDKLNGKTIYMIPGNHDDFDHYYRADDSRFILCPDVVVAWVSQPGQKLKEIWMSHYPMMTWPHRENGAWQLFGHIHSKPGKREGVDQNLPLHWNQLDVGCDFWNYKPVSLDHLTEVINNRKIYKEFSGTPFMGN